MVAKSRAGKKSAPARTKDVAPPRVINIEPHEELKLAELAATAKPVLKAEPELPAAPPLPAEPAPAARVEKQIKTESGEPALVEINAKQLTPGEQLKHLQAMENKLKSKDLILQENQRKIRVLKDRIARLDEELREKNKAIFGYQAEMVELNRGQEQKQTVIDNLQLQLQDALNEVAESQHLYQEAVSREEAYKAEITRLTERLRPLEKENNGLRSELKHKHQDYLLAAKELKEMQRVYRELQESFDQLLSQNTELEKKVGDLMKIKEELDGRYTRTLENIKVEIRQKQGETSRILKELHDVKSEKDELERLMDGMELKIEMLHSTNASLQRKMDKLAQQKSALEQQINHRVVQFALNVLQFWQKYMGRLRPNKDQNSAGLPGR